MRKAKVFGPDSVLTNEPGMIGAICRDYVPGMAPNGSRMRKVRSDPGDAHRDGARCVVLGSFSRNGAAGYFVEFDDAPGVSSLVAAHRLQLDEGDAG